jgi:hypothetical protein
MRTKYAIRITEDNLDRIRDFDPIVDIVVKEDHNRFFLFTEESDGTATEHDVVEEVDLAIYDGKDAGTRIILE